MKILMTCDNIGGVWTYALDLAFGLKEKNIEVILAVTGSPLTENQKSQLEGLSYYHESFKQEWMDDPWQDIGKTGKWLMKIKEAVKPDLIHLHSFTLGNLDWQVPVIITIHSDVLTWWEAVFEEPAPDRYNTYHEKAWKGMHSAAVITAPSFTMMNEAEKFYGPFRHKRVIYNGRKESQFHADQKEKCIFSIGRLWDEAKNSRLIIQAAPKINYPVYIAGNSDNMDTYGLPGNVFFLGQLTNREVREKLAKASVYLLPAVYEPFGYTFLEAAFSKCALIGGNIPSLREIWGDAMMYADVKRADLLAGMVNELMENDAALLSLGTKAYNHAHAKYQHKRMLDEYARLYHETNI